MEAVKVDCPSCYKPEMDLDFSGEISTCLYCSYEMKNQDFLQGLVGGLPLKIEGMYCHYRVLIQGSRDGLSHLAQIETGAEGVFLIQGCIDLDKVLPLVKNLQELWPNLELRVVGGISKNLETCPLCGSTEFRLAGDEVKCKCGKLIVSLPAFIFSRVATNLGISHFRRDNYLELFKTVLVKPKWWQFFSVNETMSTPIAKLHLRRKVGEDMVSYVLAVEVANEVGGLLEKSKVMDKIKKSFDLGIEVLQVEKVL